jgi:hypothetical protein
MNRVGLRVLRACRTLNDGARLTYPPHGPMFGGMPKAKHTITEEERSRRFIEKARELGTDETGKEFERLFKKAVPMKQPPKSTRENPKKV